MRKWATCSHAFRAPLPPKEALRTKTTVRHLKGSAGVNPAVNALYRRANASPSVAENGQTAVVTGPFSFRAVAHRLENGMTLDGPG
jgi:hypothetical protein